MAGPWRMETVWSAAPMRQDEEGGLNPAGWRGALGERSRPGSTPSGKAGEIAAELERRLMLGVYRFGESLSIIQLAQQFDASRQPVSMAISHLRSIGYVDIIPQVGCRIVSPTSAEITDFFLAVGRMEGVVAGFAAQRHQGDEAAVLASIAGRPTPAHLDTQAGRTAYIRTVNDFHDQIWLMARSPTLESRIAGLRKLSIFYLWQGAPKLAPLAARRLNAERKEIAGVIAGRDAEQAERLMERHIAGKPAVNGMAAAPAAGRDKA
ncbi:MAG: GntR family transcriptional regulator [Phenylobacterium sp.]|nr:GntR family transcriptional regulator [Phenylobacterium sp.]